LGNGLETICEVVMVTVDDKRVVKKGAKHQVVRGILEVMSRQNRQSSGDK
jgi:hypothetical protein